MWNARYPVSKRGQSFFFENDESMFQRKTTAIRLFGFDASDWLILILGVTLSGFLMIALV
jgi:hypothetical protein